MPVKVGNKDKGQAPNVPQFEKMVAVKGGDRKCPTGPKTTMQSTDGKK